MRSGVRLAGPADLAGDHDPIGRGQGLGGDPGARVGGQIGIDDAVGDAIADLVGMALGHRLAGEQVIGSWHARFPFAPTLRPRHRSRCAAPAPRYCATKNCPDCNGACGGKRILVPDGRWRSSDVLSRGEPGSTAQCGGLRPIAWKLARALVNSNKRLRTCGIGDPVVGAHQLQCLPLVELQRRAARRTRTRGFLGQSGREQILRAFAVRHVVEEERDGHVQDLAELVEPDEPIRLTPRARTSGSAGRSGPSS